MLAVIFELEPKDGMADEYFHTAAKLKQELNGISGFISIERFESKTTPGKYLSLSFWKDEAAITAWRNIPSHRNAQAAGRTSIFKNYRLRVARVHRDYGLDQRASAPADSRAIHS